MTEGHGRCRHPVPPQTSPVSGEAKGMALIEGADLELYGSALSCGYRYPGNQANRIRAVIPERR